ncbi:hypothetical protein J4460_01850 [Candidatus Woesearchaeota archaeon]|nr:MAG: hypothetical protein QS99_C0003G0047 [archaeon GW2011_AR4]MBS3129395.1 hypothetical protein [Candidatus Woesearchaeota archaeon]HIH38436.1 hypothetical protein [Candidatus Woesearchaeota archaeon]HIH48105.1 hypothetical protein [Candidatus Woesearchaeota archaeon]HIJ03449.1 hypothetical protein [Candidatus Woesearchaeota archaeon]
MIDKKQFAGLRKTYAALDEEREKLIIHARAVIKSSKCVIYAVHRGDLSDAQSLVKSLKQEFEFTKKISQKNGDLDTGMFKVAEQEFVEAMALYILVTDRRLATQSELGVSLDGFLLGLCDLSGELVRKSINAARAEDYSLVSYLHDFLEELYGEILQFDLRNGEIRKKFDGMKYDIRKLDDLLLDLKMRGLNGNTKKSS